MQFHSSQNSNVWQQGPTLDDQTYKKGIKDKNLFYQRFVKNTDLERFKYKLERFCSLQNNLTITNETAKQQ